MRGDGDGPVPADGGGANRGGRAADRPPVWRRCLLLGVTAVGLYVVWPTLLQTWAAAPSLRDGHPGWFAAVGGFQAGSFLCMWFLQRLALDSDGMFLVATSQLTGNAISKVVPAGGAAAAAVQHQMLVRGGTDPSRSVDGVTISAVLTNGAVFLLPLLAIPVLFGPGQVAPSLAQAAGIGLLIAVALILVGILLARYRPAIVLIGRAVQAVSDLVRRRHERDLPERLTARRDDLLRFLGPRWLRAVAWTAGKVGLDLLSLLAALMAVGAEPRPALVVLAYVAAMVLTSIPVTPGGLGFVEAGLAATLVMSGVPATLATTSTLAYRLVSFWLPLVAGAPAYLMFARRYGSVAVSR